MTSDLTRKPSTLVELLRSRATHRENDLAYTFVAEGKLDARRMTYGELDRRARAIGVWLRTGSAERSRVLLLYPPGLDFIAAFFGCLYAGVIAVPAQPPHANRPMSRLQSIAADSEASVVLTTSAILRHVERHLAHARELAGLKWLNSDQIPAGLEAAWQPPGLSTSSPAFLQYTSGATGTPKGVIVSHGNLMHNLESIRRGCYLTSSDTGVFWLPSYHDMGLIGGILTPMYVGGTSTLMSPAACLQRPVRWLEAVTRYGGTISGAPNFAYQLCVDKITRDERATLDLSTWSVAFCGAEPISPRTLEEFVATFASCGLRPNVFYPCYGLAESTLLVSGGSGPNYPTTLAVRAAALEQNQVVCDVTADVAPRRLVSCGHAFPGQTILVVNPETLTACASNEVGEIWVKGESVAQGYWKKPDETERTFRAFVSDSGDGPFLRTGDLGFLHGGELFVTGRIKDVIIIHGRNHYPQDIELTAGTSHPALQTGATCAFSVTVDGQERLVIVSELARHHREVEVREVTTTVRRAVAASHDLPLHALLLVEPMTIPKTSSGKHRRLACREDFLDGRLKVIGEWRDEDLVARGRVVSSQDTPAPEALTLDAIEDWLTAKVAEASRVRAEDVDRQQPFASFGLDSIQAVGLMGELERWLGRRVQPTLPWDYPSIRALAGHLAGEGAVRADDLEPTAANASASEPVAVIGMACRFPGAAGPAAFWQVLRDGVDVISEVPKDRWNVDSIYDPNPAGPGKVTTRWGGFLEHVDQFDAPFFGISESEARLMDPQQRLLLEVTWEALEDAGIVADRLRGSQTGVFVGISNYDYALLQSGEHEHIGSYSGTGNAHSIAANRLSYHFDLRGPSIAVDTACSSSLVAVHLAIQSLRSHESYLALAGGVNLILSPGPTIAFSKAQMMAADGRCKTFDASADGYVRAEGCGMIVLKRLSDALRDGDVVLAVLRGSAVNQDGRSYGLTAPNGLSQQAVMRQAMRDAGVAPADLDYIEAHGTGTPLGDPIEIESIKAVLKEDDRRTDACVVGSVKTNIGHLEAAAGIAGLQKVVLSLQHGEIPRQLHLKQLNPLIRLDDSPIVIATSTRPIPPKDGPRLAGVSSFGFGGTNAHIIVAEAPSIRSARPTVADPDDRRLPRFHLIPVSARSPAALRALAGSYRAFLEEGGSDPVDDSDALADISYTACARRSHLDYRLALVENSRSGFVDGLVAFERGQSRRGMTADLDRTARGLRLAFVFSGQGSQWWAMARQLLEEEASFRATIHRCDEVLKRYVSWSLLAELTRDEPQSRLQETQIAQPALLAIQLALVARWRSCGVRPDAVVGHSVGEIAAAYTAGILSLEDAILLASARGRCMQRAAGQGRMLAVALNLVEAQSYVTENPDQMSIAAINGPNSVVLSGDSAALDEVLKQLEARAVFARMLPVDYAFHSPQMASYRDALQQSLAGIRPRAAVLPIVSTVSGHAANGEEFGASYWSEQIAKPVRFESAISELIGDGFNAFVEISPHPVLSSAIAECLSQRGQDGLVLPSLRRGEDDRAVLLRALGDLYTHGVEVNWAGLFPTAGHFVRLPGYPWQRNRYWWSIGKAVDLTSDSRARPERDAPLPRAMAGRWLESAQHPDEYVWETDVDQRALPYLADYVIEGTAQLPIAVYLEMALTVARAVLQTDVVTLKNIEIHMVLALPDDAGQTVQVIFNSLPDGAGDSRFCIFSRPANGDGPRRPWVTLASGLVGRDVLQSESTSSVVGTR